MRLILASLALFSLNAFAHPGALNKQGCHTNHQTGEYHCHHKPEEAPPAKPEAVSAPSPEALRVISWNLKHLGRQSFDSKSAARMIADAEILVFQEVDSGDSGRRALDRMAAELAQEWNEKACKAWSEIPPGQTERYAFVWRNSRVAYVAKDGRIIRDCADSAYTIRLGVRHAEQIAREPAYGTFFAKAAERLFILAPIHLLPAGKSPEKEVEPLFTSFQELTWPTIIAGDFNLDSRDPVFALAREEKFTPALEGQPTSLKRSQRELHKALDNFWFRAVRVVQARVLNLFELLPGMEPTEIYSAFSDHCPIEAVFEFSGAGEE